ncbi:hypothetical protein C9374_002400 [Naegleria lovaniensis]|uniref:Protein kinase domain-containing protein n=1 Tax=Naegleria lovaniensis TaxID=51637 RepID=A0AA88GQR4_NAELO|nr:uncharacterized protein C9374_002400 [Naegleria lovaniensis]KAG2386656.1 hypothetical protein C9374_002400 [Naegleria lovaniensis]
MGNSSSLPFVLRPEFIVPVLIVILVFSLCVSLLVYRFLTRRRRRDGSSEPLWLLAGGLFRKSSSRRQSSTNSEEFEETLPLTSSKNLTGYYNHHQENSSWLDGFSNLFTPRKRTEENSEENFTVSSELLFQVKLFLRTTDYELVEKKETLKLLLDSKKTHTKNNAFKTFVFCENTSSTNTIATIICTNTTKQPFSLITDLSCKRAFLQFMSGLGQLSPYILNVIHIDLDGQGKCFALVPYMSEGALFDLLEKTKRENPNIQSFMDPDSISQLSGQILCALKVLQQIGIEFTHLSTKNILIEKSNDISSSVPYTCKLSCLEDQFLLFSRNTFTNTAKNAVEAFGFVLYEMCTGIPCKAATDINLDRVLYASFRKILNDIFPLSLAHETSTSQTHTSVTLDQLLNDEAFYCDPNVVASMKNQEVQMGSGLKSLLEKLHQFQTQTKRVQITH